MIWDTLGTAEVSASRKQKLLYPTIPEGLMAKVDTAFLEYTPNAQRRRMLLSSGILAGIVGIILTVIIISMHDTPTFQHVISHVMDNIGSLSLLGIFYLTSLGALFFIPLPIETLFFVGLTQGNPVGASLMLLAIGLTIGHVIDYILGLYLSPLFINLVSKKQIYRLRRWVNRWGIYAILVANMVPLPAPVLTFGLGMIRYNPTRLFGAIVVGNVVKYAVILLLFWGKQSFL